MRKIIELLLILSQLLILSSCSILDPDAKRTRVTGERKKVFIAQSDYALSDEKKIIIKNESDIIPNKLFITAKRKIDAERSLGLTNKPLVFDNNKVISLDSKGTLTAYSLDLKKKFWNISIASKDNNFIAGKITQHKGIIYLTYGTNEIIAINGINGSEIWRQKLDDILRGRAKVVENTLFLHSAHNKIYALNKENGELLWKHEDADYTAMVFTDFSPIIEGDTVFFQVNSDEIVCLDKKDGSLQRLISPNAIHGRRLLEVHKNLPNHFFIDSGVAYSVSRDGKLYTIECESNKIIWSKKVNIATKFLVYKNNIYAITSNGELLALDKNDGSLVYAVDLISYLDKKENNHIRHKWTRPILYNDKILVSNYSGELMIFDAYSGKIIAKSKEKHLITSSPFLSVNYIYTISNNGFIYRYTYE